MGQLIEKGSSKFYLGFITLIIAVLLATLPFHYVYYYSDFKVFTKDNLTFKDTFVSEDDINKIILRYNNADIVDKTLIRNEPLFKKSIEAGFILDNQNEKEENTEIDNSEISNDLAEIQIGTQIWSTRNLNVSSFKNGDPIPEAKSINEWRKFTAEEKPAWCYYENDPENGEKYGKLYNWYAVNDARGLAPEGWHIPEDQEWKKLTDYLVEFTCKKMKSSSGWLNDGNGTNESGFTGLPGGERFVNISYTEFASLGIYGYWWSSTEESSYYNTAVAYVLTDDAVEISRATTISRKGNGRSVRCIKD